MATTATTGRASHARAWVIASALGAWTAALAGGCGDKGDGDGKHRPQDGGGIGQSGGTGGSATADAGGGSGGSCLAPDGGGAAGCSIPGCGPGVALPPGE